MRRLLLLSLPGLLAACDPQAVADNTVRRAAAGVVQPILTRVMPAAPAAAATECILQAASIEELRALASDYGVEAGTLTKQNVRNLAARPNARACLATVGLQSGQL